MAGAKAEEYYYNVFFRTKLILLALVNLARAHVSPGAFIANALALDRAPAIPGTAKVAAALSLLLWTSVLCCGRGIGYIEPPLEKIHAGLHFAEGSGVDRCACTGRTGTADALKKPAGEANAPWEQQWCGVGSPQSYYDSRRDANFAAN